VDGSPRPGHSPSRAKALGLRLPSSRRLIRGRLQPEPAATRWLTSYSRGVDFGHFRYNLLGDFGFEVAERFLDIYRTVTRTEPTR